MFFCDHSRWEATWNDGIVEGWPLARREYWVWKAEKDLFYRKCSIIPIAERSGAKFVPFFTELQTAGWLLKTLQIHYKKLDVIRQSRHEKKKTSENRRSASGRNTGENYPSGVAHRESDGWSNRRMHPGDHHRSSLRVRSFPRSSKPRIFSSGKPCNERMGTSPSQQGCWGSPSRLLASGWRRNVKSKESGCSSAAGQKNSRSDRNRNISVHRWGRWERWEKKL